MEMGTCFDAPIFLCWSTLSCMAVSSILTVCLIAFLLLFGSSTPMVQKNLKTNAKMMSFKSDILDCFNNTKITGKTRACG